VLAYFWILPINLFLRVLLKEPKKRRTNYSTTTTFISLNTKHGSIKFIYNLNIFNTKSLIIPLTVQTVRTYLREPNLKTCSPRKVPLLNARHISKRMKFAKDNANWSPDQWRNILLSGESKVIMSDVQRTRNLSPSTPQGP